MVVRLHLIKLSIVDLSDLQNGIFILCHLLNHCGLRKPQEETELMLNKKRSEIARRTRAWRSGQHEQGSGHDGMVRPGVACQRCGREVTDRQARAGVCFRNTKDLALNANAHPRA